MSDLQRILFISDLHLDPRYEDITSQFIYLLSNCDSSVQAIYILGDLFEMWIGDDDTSTFHSEITAKMRETAQKGVKLYFMHGNRDFLIGKKFATDAGCSLLGEEEVIDAFGTPILLLHGDTLCTLDHSYQRVRKIAQNKILQKIFLSLPLSWRLRFANWARSKSSQHTKRTDKRVMDVSQEAVDTMMKKHNVNYLIHGHTHKPNIHHIDGEDVKGERIVLPAWHDGGCVFEWRSNGEKSFRALTESNLEPSL